jgi:hypothetical protein
MRIGVATAMAMAMPSIGAQDSVIENFAQTPAKYQQRGGKPSRLPQRPVFLGKTFGERASVKAPIMGQSREQEGQISSSTPQNGAEQGHTSPMPRGESSRIHSSFHMISLQSFRVYTGSSKKSVVQSPKAPTASTVNALDMFQQEEEQNSGPVPPGVDREVFFSIQFAKVTCLYCVKS